MAGNSLTQAVEVIPELLEIPSNHRRVAETADWWVGWGWGVRGGGSYCGGNRSKGGGLFKCQFGEMKSTCVQFSEQDQETWHKQHAERI